MAEAEAILEWDGCVEKERESEDGLYRQASPEI